MNYFSCLNNHCFYSNSKVIHVSGRGLHWVECQALIRFLKDQGLDILNMGIKKIGEDRCRLVLDLSEK